MENKDTFTKRHVYAVIGYDYIGTSYVCNIFDEIGDAHNFIEKEDDGWVYTIQETFFYSRNLPF